MKNIHKKNKVKGVNVVYSPNDIIKKLLKKAGISSRRMSINLGLCPNAISYYISGKRNPSLESAYKIINFAKQYDISITLEELLPEDKKCLQN